MMSDYFSFLNIHIYCCHSLFIIFLKRQVLVDWEISRGVSVLPGDRGPCAAWEEGGPACQDVGQRKGPVQDLRVHCSVVPG